jgi:hypothetical protein
MLVVVVVVVVVSGGFGVGIVIASDRVVAIFGFRIQLFY